MEDIIMKICSDDGKVFGSVDACKIYETELKHKELAKKEAADRKVQDFKVIEEMLRNIDGVIKNYERKHDEKVTIYTRNGDLHAQSFKNAPYINLESLFFGE